MTACKSGAVVVVDASGGLEGIFTHGDFVRGYQENRHIAELTVGERMTRNPVHVVGGMLATEALEVLEAHRIDDLVVLDEGGKVIGLVDVQDLTRAHIF
jgi:arabinose-5-phosphate isomerase